MDFQGLQYKNIRAQHSSFITTWESVFADKQCHINSSELQISPEQAIVMNKYPVRVRLAFVMAKIYKNSFLMLDTLKHLKTLQVNRVSTEAASSLAFLQTRPII